MTRAPDHVIKSLVEARSRLLPESRRRSAGVTEAFNGDDARIYIDSWILPEIESALAWALGAPKDYDGYRLTDRELELIEALS